MPEIDVTEEQRRRLAEVRDDLAAAYVGRYGHVRPRDAVEYLLDTYTPPEKAPEAAAAAGPGPADGPAAEPGTDDGTDGLAAGPGDGSADDETDGSGLDSAGASTVVTADADDADATPDPRAASPMNLLEEHTDRWRRAESGDAPYEVDLPDGSTEPARTKDDVRRLLFQHY